MAHVDDAVQSNSSFGLLALRLDGDLAPGATGRSVLLAAVDDDAVAVETITELAWHLAEEQGRSVLMVDGTFGRSTLSEALGITEGPGLTDLLAEGSLDAKRLHAAVRPTRCDGIAFLPRGVADNERLVGARSDTIRQLLALAVANHDFVLVQGSLLNDSARSLAFGVHIDAALLVAVDGGSSMQAVERGRGLLNDCGAQRIGLVLASAPGAPGPTGGPWHEQRT